MMLLHLRWVERNKRQAQSVALKIIDYQMQYPDRPVHLVGHSAGAGIALMALENLPEHHQVDAVILLAACVSPEYDLTSALNRTKRGIYNYYSIVDAPLQVVGTTLAGTLDSQIGPAAGALGFRPPESLDAQGKKAYQRLFQRHFQTADFRLLNFGSHYGTLSRPFAKQEIAPRLVNNDNPTWNKD
jgi:alpha-beta hydrolase superfamily lysophospholipase